MVIAITKPARATEERKPAPKETQHDKTPHPNLLMIIAFMGRSRLKQGMVFFDEKISMRKQVKLEIFRDQAIIQPVAMGYLGRATLKSYYKVKTY